MLRDALPSKQQGLSVVDWHSDFTFPLCSFSIQVAFLPILSEIPFLS